MPHTTAADVGKVLFTRTSDKREQPVGPASKGCIWCGLTTDTTKRVEMFSLIVLQPTATEGSSTAEMIKTAPHLT